MSFRVAEVSIPAHSPVQLQAPLMLLWLVRQIPVIPSSIISSTMFYRQVSQQVSFSSLLTTDHLAESWLQTI